ncbi:MAG: pyroglutamyl-peptidase I [Candidatus Devosia phytovorans]|uniref:Pyroglutamyl-peptidase I n=1 Tax=Candidatus Devosia phytovorans TaxID=3121372 RepID=A0AAJ5VTE8_9HYPH|nr:pyroglutamyl-peptidase I [Devosia sp.]WEK03019.1 MAG: pyroglutamyl-peptidase I [Devosia sp.]
MKTILLTGFEPFAGAALNPSWEAVQRVAAQWTDPARLHVAQLPVEFGEGVERLEAMIGLLRPDIVVATGLAEGRAAITPEVIAINRIDARIPDNAGAQPVEAAVVPGGADGLFSTLPVKAMVAAMRDAGVPAALSYSAGTFVCNAAFYALMNLIQRQDRPMIGGFVHVPAMPESRPSADMPTMAVETMARGLEAALMVCLGGADAYVGSMGTIA